MTWTYFDFPEVVCDITGGNRKFQSNEYRSSGSFPIIDQGDSFIGGYTDSEEIVSRGSDVVVFGDHTKCLKYVDFDFCLGADGVKILEPVGELDSKFLYYFLKTVNLPDVGYSRHYKFLKAIKVPVPPFPVQKQIAETLDKADALRQKDQLLLQKYDELAQSIFYEMFGGPGQNEKGWLMSKIGELTQVSSGSTPDRKLEEYYGGGIPWVKTTEVKGELITNTEETISNEGLNNSSCKLHPKGSVIVAMYGQGKTRGQVGLLGIDATTNQACGVIKPCKGLNPVFLFNYLKLSYEDLRSLGRGGNQENLNGGMIKEYSIFVPPLNLQNRFESVMSNLDKQVAVLRTDVSENLYQSLMNEFFS